MTQPAAHPIDSVRLLHALRRLSGHPDLDLAAAPSRVAFGGEAVIDALDLRNPPPELAGKLVLRRIHRSKHPLQVAREVATHAALIAQGFPVPRVRLFEASDDLLGVPFLVVDRLEGQMLLAEVMDPSALGRRPLRIPALAIDALWRVPRLLAEIHARLHRLDPEPFLSALLDAGLRAEETSFAGRLDALEEQAADAELAGLMDGMHWLRRHARADRGAVICHGDLVFTNIHVAAGRVVGVLDWSHATLAEAEYDLAGALIRLESTVPGVPAPLAATFRFVQRRMQERFLQRYRRSHMPDAAALDYYAAFWLLQELVTAGERLRAGAVPSAHATDRWLHGDVIRAGVRAFEARTGVVLDPLLP